jgi:hypothetical protein
MDLGTNKENISMIIVNDMPEQIDASLMQRLAKVETATVGHFRSGIFMPPDFRPVLAETSAVGTAVTLSLPGMDSTLLHYTMGLVRPGDVLVIDRGNDHVNACLQQRSFRSDDALVMFRDTYFRVGKGQFGFKST